LVVLEDLDTMMLTMELPEQDQVVAAQVEMLGWLIQV
jgi:hypothetical protein